MVYICKSEVNHPVMLYSIEEATYFMQRFLNSWVLSVYYNDSFHHKALTRSCVGSINEAVRIHTRRRNSLVTLYSESGPLHPLTIPEDQWASSMQHQGTGSRSGVIAVVKGTSEYQPQHVHWLWGKGAPRETHTE